MADRFRALELDIDFSASEVRRQGELLELPPRALEILAVLLRRPGELVTRDEISAAVWNGAYVDFDRSVNLYVSQLRKEFGDDARDPRYIETVPRKGYRFVAPVSEEPGRIRIVVLPFENLGPSGDEYLSHGMTDELILQLGRLGPEGLEVIASTTAFTYKGTAKTAAEIGRELDATHLVEGSVRRHDDEVRIGARLVGTRDEALLWSDAFQEALPRLLWFQSRIARAIASEIRIQLSPKVASRLKGHVPIPEEAYDLYLKGRHLFFSPQHGPNRRGLEFLERAIELAPDFAAPRWMLAEALVVAASNSSIDQNTVRPIIRKHADRSLVLDPQSAEAWACHALVRALVDWDWAGAEEEVRRALALGAGVDTLRLSGITRLTMGRFDEALAALVRAVELDPLSLHTSFIAGWAFHRARRYPEAIDRLEKTVAVDPSGPTGSLFLADCYLHEGKTAQARELCAQRLETTAGPPMVLAYAASVFARADRGPEAQAIVTRLEERVRSNYVDPYYLAAAYAGLGENDRALTHLKRAVQERSCVMSIAKFDSFLDPLRSDARFDAILKALDLPIT